MRTWAIMLGGGAMAFVLYAALYREQAPVAAIEKTEPDLFAFVRSMEGTRPDGAISTSAGDALVVDAELGRLFDYYLTGLGEASLGAIRLQIEADLERRLTPAAAREAKRLLAAYLAYMQALSEVEQDLPPEADMLSGARLRQQAMRALRGNYFTQKESDGLFGAQDAYDGDAIARMEVMTDPALSATQRAEKLAILEQQMPAAVRAEREAPRQVLKLEEAVLALRASGAGDNEVYRLRANTFSTEAAARLAEVDRDEAYWQRRIDQYRQARASLPAASVEESAAALRQLRDTFFEPDEQLRLDAYE